MIEFVADLFGERGRHDIPTERGLDDQCRLDFVPVGYFPDLGSGRVVDRYQVTRDVGWLTGIGIPSEFDDLRAGRIRLTRDSSCRRWLPPARCVVECYIRAADADRVLVSLVRLDFPSRAMLRNQLHEIQYRVASDFDTP